MRATFLSALAESALPACTTRPRSAPPIEVIWTITGTVYSDREDPASDFEQTDFIGGGFVRPQATYKVVGWFDRRGLFQARGYLFDQTGENPTTHPDPVNHIVPIRDIELRTGVDYFPYLKDYIEDVIETRTYDTMWGE